MTAKEFEELWQLVISTNGDRQDTAAMLAVMFREMPESERNPHIIEEQQRGVLREVRAGIFIDDKDNKRILASLLAVSLVDLGLERRQLARAS